jgi:hypothetical protein
MAFVYSEPIQGSTTLKQKAFTRHTIAGMMTYLPARYQCNVLFHSAITLLKISLGHVNALRKAVFYRSMITPEFQDENVNTEQTIFPDIVPSALLCDVLCRPFLSHGYNEPKLRYRPLHIWDKGKELISVIPALNEPVTKSPLFILSGKSRPVRIVFSYES